MPVELNHTIIPAADKWAPAKFLAGLRGVYFDDPNGHLFELIARPCGAKPESWAKS